MRYTVLYVLGTGKVTIPRLYLYLNLNDEWGNFFITWIRNAHLCYIEAYRIHSLRHEDKSDFLKRRRLNISDSFERSK